MPKAARAPSYAQRLDRVLDHIADDLAGDLSLARLARVAGFSPFHFHRLFQGHTGETLHAHVRRVRVERAASLMRMAPRRALTEIALEVGFPALSDLSRAFKARFGLPPSRWDRRDALPDAAHHDVHAKLAPAVLAAPRVRIATLPRSLFVYTRVFDPYGSQRLVDAYHATRSWIDTIGRAPEDVIFAGMSMDDPAIVPAAQCRYDLGVVFPFASTGIAADIARARGAALRVAPPSPLDVDRAGFSARRFAALELATLPIQGDLAAVGAAWQWLYATYLPGQRRLPAHHPAMELFVRLPEHIGWERFDLFACVPLA